jgi:hypothetical protein
MNYNAKEAATQDKISNTQLSASIAKKLSLGGWKSRND